MVDCLRVGLPIKDCLDLISRWPWSCDGGSCAELPLLSARRLFGGAVDIDREVRLSFADCDLWSKIETCLAELQRRGRVHVPLEAFEQASREGTERRMVLSWTPAGGVRVLTAKADSDPDDPITKAVSAAENLALWQVLQAALRQEYGGSLNLVREAMSVCPNLDVMTQAKVLSLCRAASVQRACERFNGGLSIREILIIESRRLLLSLPEGSLRKCPRVRFDFARSDDGYLQLVEGLAFEAHWLSWQTDDILYCDLPAQLHEGEPRYFLTSALSGCSVGVLDRQEYIRVFHRNGKPPEGKEKALGASESSVVWLHHRELPGEARPCDSIYASREDPPESRALIWGECMAMPGAGARWRFRWHDGGWFASSRMFELRYRGGVR